jgi:hypothetical protein
MANEIDQALEFLSLKTIQNYLTKEDNYAK